MDFYCCCYLHFATEVSEAGKRSGIPACLSASYTSTIGEQLVTLLRKLHVMDAWNSHINGYINDKLSLVADMALPVSLCWGPAKVKAALSHWKCKTPKGCHIYNM